MTTGPHSERLIDVAVFTAAADHSVFKAVSKMLELPFPLRVHVLVHQPPKRVKDLFRSQLRNIKKHGWRWIPYQLSEILSLVNARYSRNLNTRVTGQKYTSGHLAKSERVEISRFESVNGAEAQSYLAAVPNLQLGVSLAAPILDAGTFEIPALGTINLHKGKLPDYRGMPPAFWEILAGESQVGVSVHAVESGLDTGAVVKTGVVAVEQYSSPKGLRVALDELGNDLIAEAVADFLSGNQVTTPQKGDGKTNSRPALKLEWEMARSVARKEGTDSNTRLAKDSIFNAFSVARFAGDRLGILKPIITVLLYHRVSDAFRDSVTIGVETFDKQLEYLKNNFKVCSLRSLVNGELSIDDHRRLVCITFDDGYLDNYSNAAPLLLKHGLPATFFVSTDKIANQTPFQHDLDKLGYGLPNMTWDNIREMDREGFDFGSHTVNHADLGSLTEDRIVEELAQSKQAIENELGYKEVLFAYPFGKQCNFSERARDIARDVGYICCCSAFGGQNLVRQWDPFDIKRIGINYNFSIAALRARIYGWKHI